jgi:hypothetical protein
MNSKSKSKFCQKKFSLQNFVKKDYTGFVKKILKEKRNEFKSDDPEIIYPELLVECCDYIIKYNLGLEVRNIITQAIIRNDLKYCYCDLLKFGFDEKLFCNYVLLRWSIIDFLNSV